MAEERKEKENREEAPRRSWGGRLLRGAAVLVLLAVVFGLVTAATMSGGRYKDRFRRWLLYGSSQAENLYSFSADSDHAFDQLGEYLAVASRNSLQLLRGDGTAQQEITIGMSQPALATGGGLAVVWDAGGSALTVADGDGVLLERDTGDHLLSVRLNRSGWLAVTEEKSGYRGAVTVYSPEQEEVFSYFSSSSFLLDAVVSRDGSRLLAVTMDQAEGAFVSGFLVYELDRTEPVATGELRDALVMDLADRERGCVALADSLLAFVDESGATEGTYAYGGAYLRDYALGGEEFAALLLGRYRAGSVGRLVTVGADGEELASLDLTREVLDLSAAGDFLAVLYSDELVIYHSDLTPYAASQATELAGRVLMSEDGSALVISADSAWRFLP